MVREKIRRARSSLVCLLSSGSARRLSRYRSNYSAAICQCTQTTPYYHHADNLQFVLPVCLHHRIYALPSGHCRSTQRVEHSGHHTATSRHRTRTVVPRGRYQYPWRIRSCQEPRGPRRLPSPAFLCWSWLSVLHQLRRRNEKHVVDRIARIRENRNLNSTPFPVLHKLHAQYSANRIWTALSNTEIQRIIDDHNLVPTLDKKAGVKYLTWNTNQWVSYDDAETYKLKTNYANSLCLAGTSKKSTTHKVHTG